MHGMVKVTESWNPRSKGIDERSLIEIVGIINELDSEITGIIRTQLKEIAESSQLIIDTLKHDGRVFFVGAGSSGRLGFQEASEIPPTFGLSPVRFQAIMAGGHPAVTGSVEGAEDDREAGARAVLEHDLKERDLLIAVAASGSTPFVLGAVEQTKEIGVTVIGITNNYDTLLSSYSDICVEAVIGPEVVAGSTRMRAGTAQKMVLNMITSAAMMKLGFVHDGYMVGVQATNSKLKIRAQHMIAEITDSSDEKVVNALSRSDGDVRVAVLMILKGKSPQEAKQVLEKFGSIRKILEE